MTGDVCSECGLSVDKGVYMWVGTLNPKSEIRNSKPQTPNPKPQASTPNPETVAGSGVGGGARPGRIITCSKR